MASKGESSISKLANHAMDQRLPSSMHPAQKEMLDRVAEKEQQQFINGQDIGLDDLGHRLPLASTRNTMHSPAGWTQEFPMETRMMEHQLEHLDLSGQSSNWTSEFQNNQYHPKGMIPLRLENSARYMPPSQHFYPATSWVSTKDEVGNNPLTATAWENEFKKHLETTQMDNLQTTGEHKEAEKNHWEADFEEMWLKVQESSFGKDFASEFKSAFSDMPNEVPAEFKDILPFEVNEMKSMEEADPVFSECIPYEFEEQNEYLKHSDPYQAGMELLESQGSLSLAALAFEAAVQRDPHNDEAWLRLGRAQAENEKELPAIAALQRSVQENPQNLESLLNLAVSYTNEGQNDEVYATLDRWLRTKFPQLKMEPPKESQDAQSRLVKYFIDAIQLDSTNEKLDPDLQVGLGLLFYTVQEFEKTIDCFTAALSGRVDDYLLWNRLGATLSNSGKSMH
jgi:tetratricopeptide (TPR) repeat protein